MKRDFGYLLLMATCLLIWACSGRGLSPQNVSLSDPQIQPLLKAMEQVDRSALGFTSIPTNARVSLEIGSGQTYDAMLHIYGDTSRTIAFRKTSTNSYRWISEQESHEGPKWFQTVDGTFREYIVIEYQTESVNGIPTNQSWIRYTGPNTNLIGRDLTLAEVQPILAQWRTAQVEPRPPEIADGFEPGPSGILLFMFLVFVIFCCFILAITVVGVALFIAFVVAGIFSSSIIIGVLRKSVSAGFRALFIQLGAVGGMAAGAVVTTGVIYWTKSPWNSPARWTIGIVLGLLIGALFALLFNMAWGWIAKILTQRTETPRK